MQGSERHNINSGNIQIRYSNNIKSTGKSLKYDRIHDYTVGTYVKIEIPVYTAFALYIRSVLFIPSFIARSIKYITKILEL